MSINKRPGGPYVVPLLTDDGSEAVAAGERGKYTLAANKTYVAILGGNGALAQTVQIEWASGIVFTSISIEGCNADPDDISNIDTAAGAWIEEDPSTAYVPVEGSGVTATNATLAGTASGVGGATFHLGNIGYARTRLTFVVGGTGGVVRISEHGRD